MRRHLEQADQKSDDGRPCPTNVAKLFEATCQQDSQGIQQLAHYIRGVGTRGDEKFRGGRRRLSMSTIEA
ncbi:MAG: DUF2235 domain-containing protein [Methylomonas sp.]|nr:DUF2235 domain-containing protein [Methylomonas sp.]